MLLKKESVEAHIYRTFTAATLWGKLVFYAFGNDSPGPLFKSHAHKFLVFTTGQKMCYSVLFFNYQHHLGEDGEASWEEDSVLVRAKIQQTTGPSLDNSPEVGALLHS